MEEPSVPELIRALSVKVDGVREMLVQQHDADQRLIALQLDAVAKDQAEDRLEISRLRTRLDVVGRLVWTVLVGPIVVSLVVWSVTRTVP